MLLLDLDGTLSDPLVGIARSINHALTAHGYEPRPQATLGFCVGPTIDEIFITLANTRDPGTIAALVATFRERYGEVGYSENTLYPGIPEAIAALVGRGIPLGLCTSKRADFADCILRMFGLREAFRFVSGGEVGVQKWQQIETLLREGTITTGALMIGDRGSDISAARRNGLGGIGVLWGYGSREELEAESPQALLESPAALADLTCTTQTGM